MKNLRLNINKMEMKNIKFNNGLKIKDKNMKSNGNNIKWKNKQ